MSDLRTRVIRLAHENPSLRPHLLPLLKSAAGLRPDQLLRSPEDFKLLVPGDRVTISGRPAVIISYESFSNNLAYALEGKSIRKVLDAGLAMSEENEYPEVEIHWKSAGEPAGKTRLPPRRRPV